MNNIIEINHLYKTYNTLLGETKSLNDINLNIKGNEFLTIIGPSGCGKSTLLNLIADLDDYEGTIKIKDNYKIGYMCQDDLLFPWLTILDNALIGLKIQKKLTKENIEYTKELLEKYGLKDFINKYPKELSGGMKQRVA